MALLAAGVIGVAALVPLSPAAEAREPRLTVPRDVLAAAMSCRGELRRGGAPPLLFVPGTGSDASQVLVLGQGAFDALGRPVCTLSLPYRTTGDVQVSVEYVVHAVRRLARRVGRPVALAGVSQGALLARIALTYWPSLRARVSDVVSAAGTHHGTTAVTRRFCRGFGCPPAVWQQMADSRFLAALNARRDETPGRRTAWTTVRSVNDELVQPQTGPRPTSALRGAANILIQSVCPGRVTLHLGTAVDSVTIAVLHDALAHPGPAKASRLPPDVCSHPYGTGLDERSTASFLQAAKRLFAAAIAGLPRVPREPKLRAWVRRGR